MADPRNTAQLCMLSYGDADSPFPGAEIRLFNQGTVQGFVMHIPELHRGFVVFRGTDELGDWWTNLDTQMALGPWPGTHIHKGFLDAYNDVKADINAAVQYFESEAVETIEWVGTGHSLGGALITVMQAYTGGLFHEIHTYGSPRVFDTAGAKVFNSRYPNTHRWTYQSDIVTRVPHVMMKWSWNPLKIRARNFKHVGLTRWHNGNQWVTEVPWYRRVWVYVSKRKASWPPLVGEPVKDHPMSNYYNAIP
jgi:hypothetical protein